MANIIITGASSGVGFEAVLDLTSKKGQQSHRIGSICRQIEEAS